MNVAVKRRLLRRDSDPQRRGLSWIWKALIITFASVSLLITAAVGAVFIIYNTFADGYVPIQDKLTQRFVGLSEVYDRGGRDGGVYLGTIANPQGQLLNPVPLDKISPYLVAATISTEDNSFWDNPGVDIKG